MIEGNFYTVEMSLAVLIWKDIISIEKKSSRSFYYPADDDVSRAVLYVHGARDELYSIYSLSTHTIDCECRTKFRKPAAAHTQQNKGPKERKREKKVHLLYREILSVLYFTSENSSLLQL